MFAQTKTVGRNETNLLELELITYFIVPLIAVFTKYDQFKDNIEISLERAGCANWETRAHVEAERVFQEQYLGKLGGKPHFVRLESEVPDNGSSFRADILLRRYAWSGQTLHRTSWNDCKCLEWRRRQCHALSGEKGKFGAEHKDCCNKCNKVSVFIQNSLKKPQFYIRGWRIFRGRRKWWEVMGSGEEEREIIIRKCVAAFPYMWFYVSTTTSLSCLLPADLALSLLTRVWVLLYPSWSPPADLTLYHCLPGCECHLLFQVICPFLSADLSLLLSLLARMWVLHLVCPAINWFLSHCLCSSECEVSPHYSDHCLLTSFILSLLIRLWVPSLICLIFVSHTVSAHQDVSAACYSHSLSADLSCSVHQDVSAGPCSSHSSWLSADLFACQVVSAVLFLSYLQSAYLSFAVSAGQHVSFSFILFTTWWPLSLCYCSPECECHLLFILFSVFLSHSCPVSACQCVSLFLDYCVGCLLTSVSVSGC